MATSRNRVLPGFRLALGYTLLYLGLIVLIPLGAVFWKTSSLSWPQFVHAVASPPAMAAYYLSFTASLLTRLTTALSVQNDAHYVDLHPKLTHLLH